MSGLVIPDIAFKIVVFPEPDGPNKTTTSFCTWKETSIEKCFSFFVIVTESKKKTTHHLSEVNRKILRPLHQFSQRIAANPMMIILTVQNMAASVFPDSTAK